MSAPINTPEIEALKGTLHPGMERTMPTTIPGKLRISGTILCLRSINEIMTRVEIKTKYIGYFMVRPNFIKRRSENKPVISSTTG